MLLRFPSTIKNWLINHYQGGFKEKSKPIMYSLCFAMGFNEKESEEFITKVFFERPFNRRNAEEAIYYFCLKNGHEYKSAVELINYYNSLNKNNISDDESTRILKNEIDDLDDTSIDYFKIFLCKNASRFNDFMTTAKKNAKELVLKAYMYSSHFNKNHNSSSKVTIKDININSLLNDILNMDLKNLTPRGEKQHTIKNNFKFLNYVALNFPDNERIGNLINDKKISYDAIRKIIILMHFYSYCSEMRKQDNYVDQIEYLEEINNILYESGFGKMYDRNPYDWIFMHCTHTVLQNRDSLDEFWDIVSDMYNPDAQ